MIGWRRPYGTRFVGYAPHPTLKRGANEHCASGAGASVGIGLWFGIGMLFNVGV